MIRCVGALLVRNEGGPDRYLRRVLENARLFCDEIVVLDDGSTDNTGEVCEEFGCKVFYADSEEAFWGRDESSLRERLWKMAWEVGGPDGWVYVLDADQELVGITPQQFRELLRVDLINSYAFPLYDCWDSDKQMRVDGFWQAHLRPRVWLAKVRPTPSFEPNWGSNRPIHSGHLPPNYPTVVGKAPHLCGIKHLGYIKKEHRLLKAQKYLSLP